MGRRGPQPTGIGEDGLIAKVLDTLNGNPDLTYTSAQVAIALDQIEHQPSIAMYLARLAHAKRIAKVRHGVYSALQP